MKKFTPIEKVQLKETLKAILSCGQSQIVFEKKDGTIRSMRCTRDNDSIPSDIVESIGNGRSYTESENSLPVYDTEKESWRSFSIDSLISINGQKFEHLLGMIKLN